MASLPSRERGLKSVADISTNFHQSSLPSRERGLKFRYLYRLPCPCVSLPSRERGLKFKGRSLVGRQLQVAPFAGAWIEIISPL